MRTLKGAWLLVAAMMAIGCMPVRHQAGPVARAPAPGPATHVRETLPVRSEDPEILELIDAGIGQSSTLAQLVRQVGQYHGLVYVRIGRCPVPGLRGCLLHVIYQTPQVRYLFIRIEATEDRLTLASTVAHELQHAVEVLKHPSIRTSRDLLLFYRSAEADAFGVAFGPFRSYETPAAIAAGAAVRSELNSHAAAAAAADDRVR